MSNDRGSDPDEARGDGAEGPSSVIHASSGAVDTSVFRETVTAEDVQPQVVLGTGTVRATFTSVATSTPIPDAEMLAGYKSVGGEEMMHRVLDRSLESWKHRESLDRIIVEHQADMDRRESEFRRQSSDQFAQSRLMGMRSALAIALASLALVAYGLHLGADFWQVGWALLIVAVLAAVLLSKDQNPIHSLTGIVQAIRGRGEPKQLELFESSDSADDDT